MQPLAYNQYTTTDVFEFVDEIRQLQINNGDILVSNDVSLEETIQILADKAFVNKWFNETHHLNLSRM